MASMASGRCALFFSSARCCNLAAHLPLDSGARPVRISCKIRRKKISSQHKRQQAKRLSPHKCVQANMDFESSDSGSEQVPNVGKDSTVDTAQDTSSSVTKREELPPAAGEKLMQIENADEGQPLQRVPLEDLIDTIKNAEKNILLLNQARIHALENLDKIISEKEALQAQINVLEMKLAETDAGNRFAAREKVKVELLEDQFEKLKTEVSSVNSTVRGNFGAYENGTDIQNPDFLLSDVDSPHFEELTALRKENMSLMNDIQALTAKLPHVEQTEERMLMLEKEKSLLEAAVKELEFGLAIAQEGVLKHNIVKDECEELKKEVENLQALLDNASRQANEAVRILEQNRKLQNKVDELEASLEVSNASKVSEKSQESTEELRNRVKMLEEQLQVSDQEIKSYIQLYQEAVKEFHIAIAKHEEEDNREPIDDMPWEFWSRLLLTIDGWLLEKKISSDTAKSLKEMAWKKDGRIRDTYLACSGKDEQEVVGTFVTLASPTRSGFHVIHIAAEMAPVAKVGGLGDVVSGLCKALQRKGHLVEIILPKYDFMQYESIADLRALDVELQSYFDGHLFQNTIWVGTVEGLPVYFVDSHHPARFFSRGKLYGEHDDFKRFSYFSRAALELIHQAGKRPDIIHCHDWQTAFIAPLYWDLYAIRGLNSARICFTCHNFEYQGTTVASELSSCGLDVHRLNRPDRMQDHSAHDRVNPVKGAIVFSNIVTTVSPTYAEEVRTAEGGWGLHETLKPHSRKFLGILNGIDTDVWNPSSDPFLRVQFAAHDLQGKAENKKFLQEQLKLSSADASQPLVGCITRLVPQKGVHLIRHAIYKTVELGGQFLLLGSSPVPHIQSEFESIADHFRSSPHVRLILKYDEALSRSIFAASDMFIVPSIFEPCGLTQMIAMRYGSIPIVRRTGGLNDSVFDLDDETIPVAVRNGFTFLTPDEQGLNGAMERAFKYYKERPEMWQQLVQKVMKIDFSWDSSAAEYEAIYENAIARAREAAAANHV